MTSASRKKPPASAIDNRFDIVIVKRSLEAANAISAGKKRSLIASAAIVCIQPAVRVISKVKVANFRFSYFRPIPASAKYDSRLARQLMLLGKLGFLQFGRAR